MQNYGLAVDGHGGGALLPPICDSKSNTGDNRSLSIIEYPAQNRLQQQNDSFILLLVNSVFTMISMDYGIVPMPVQR
jgi:hypothetical protein